MIVQIFTDNLSIGYHGRTILSEISLAIRKGEFWGIVGPNGSGKTTLVKTLAGIICPVSGRVNRAEGLTFGYVPQRNNLDDIFPLTVLDVVLMGRFPRKGVGQRLSRSDRELAMYYMRQVALEDLVDIPYRILSGGQKQRTLIARALTLEPDVLIFDEPTSGMDISGEAEMMQLILGLHRQIQRTVLMITHDLNLISNHAQKLIIVHGGNSQVETGSVQELMTDQNLKKIYRQDVHVHSVHGRTYIFVHSHEEPRHGGERKTIP